jgi:hypothetical protein
LKRHIGEGSFSNVFESLVISTFPQHLGDQYLSPSKPKDFALKYAKGFTSYSPEKRALTEAVGDLNVGIDH